MLGRVQQTRRRLVEHYKTIKDAINGSRRVILDLEKSHLARIEPAEVTLQQRILEYENSPAPCTAGGALELVSRPEGAYTIKTARVVVTDTDALIDAVLAGGAGAPSANAEQTATAAGWPVSGCGYAC